MASGLVFRLEDSISGVLVGALVILIVRWLAKRVRNWMKKRSRFLELAAKLPGPKTLPFFGNALLFACKPEQFLERTVQQIKPYEDVTPIRFWLGPLLLVVVTEPRDIEIILNSFKSACKSSSYEFLKPFIGDGLISGSGNLWRSHRKFIAPMFNIRILDGYVDTFERHSKILVKKLIPLADGNEFDIMPHLSKCTSDTVSETVLGSRKTDLEENPGEEFLHATDRLYGIVHNRIMKAWLHPDWIFRLSSDYKDQTKCKQVICRVMKKLITARQEEFTVRSKEEIENRDGRNSILEQIIRQMNRGPEKLTDEELLNEMYTLYLAAQDTVALISSFALVMLGMHKDVQEKVRSEINVVLRDTENLVASSLSDLKYLELVLKETLRLFPIAFFLGRTLKSDLALDTCVLPEGCEVVVSTYMTHRNSRHWKQPEKFIPERFIAEEAAKRHPYAYIPFSGGLMGCIGKKFAIMSLKTIVASIVRNYSIDTATRMEDIKLKSDISVRSINGYKISLTPVRRNSDGLIITN